MTAVNLSHLEGELFDVLPSDAISQDVAAYRVDGREPMLVVKPSTQAEVAAVLRLALANGTAVIPWGAGTLMALGMPPARYELALDLRALNRIVEYEPADLTVTVEAGMALSELQRFLAERGQWLPLDPDVAAEATIGGVLATNTSGPARIAFGTPRDLLIGITVASAQGELIKAGGRVVKNVAGYDLGKLQIGALGTLGVIVQTSFKVAPLSPTVRTLSTASSELALLMSTTFAVRDAALPATAMVVARAADEHAWHLTVRFAGGTAAVDRAEGELEAICRRCGLTLTADNASAAPNTRYHQGLTARVLIRSSVLPSSVSRILEAFTSAAASVEAYPTAGIIYARWPVGAIDAATLADLRRLCEDQGRGALVIEAAPVELKHEIDVWGGTRSDFDLMQRLKAEFDLGKVLNLGRFVGGL